MFYACIKIGQSYCVLRGPCEQGFRMVPKSSETGFGEILNILLNLVIGMSKMVYYTLHFPQLLLTVLYSR